MRYFPVFGPALLSAFVTAHSAKADCIYYYPGNGDDALYADSASPVLQDKIPIEFDESVNIDEIYDIGFMMNFDCLADNPPRIGALRWHKPYTPENLLLLIPVHALLQNFPMRFRMRKQAEYMSADVSCEGIVVNFDPDFFVNGGDHHEQARTFQGALLNLLSMPATSLQRNESLAGHYSINSPYGLILFDPADGPACQPPAFTS